MTSEGMPEWARQMEGRLEARVEANKSQTLLDVTGIVGEFRKEMQADRAEARTAWRWATGLLVVGFLGLAGLILA